jgi:hypothetical protein
MDYTGGGGGGGEAHRRGVVTRGATRADVAGRYASRRGHGEPRQSTVHHASTHAHGRADASRTGRARAGAELRTRRATQGHHGRAS